MFWPCETRTSTCRSFATISSGLYRFLAIAVLLDVRDIPQVGPLQWGWINWASRLGRKHRWRPDGEDHSHLALHEISRHCRQCIITVSNPAVFDGYVVT